MRWNWKGRRTVIPKTRQNKRFLIVVFAVYLAAVIWYTTLLRAAEYGNTHLDLFWSYKRWFAGNAVIGRQVIGNVLMFVPCGFLLEGILSGKRNSFLRILFAAVLISFSIEIAQLITKRGEFEFDDVINNSAGSVLGWLLFRLTEKALPIKLGRIAVPVIGCMIVTVCASVFFSRGNKFGGEIDVSSREFCFQIDDVSFDGGSVQISGFAFEYDRQATDFRIYLQSVETGRRYSLDTNCGITRSDVNEYFQCAYDYSKSGFSAAGTGINGAEEYEVFIEFARLWSSPASTGVYITGEKVNYVSQKSFVPPELEGTAIEEIIENGWLRVCRPDYSCYVYQYQGSLYWIAGEKFIFEEDGSTNVQYQLRTTQPGRLPAKRLENNYYWDNITGHFEKYEISGDFGQYRIMKRKLPTEYAIESITTGYYKNGKWIWKNYFRPIYEFGQDPDNRGG